MKYTVLLLRPDTIANPFGQDTFLAHVEAEDVELAVEAAQADAAEADGLDDSTSYHPLLVIAGHHSDLWEEAR